VGAGNANTVTTSFPKNSAFSAHLQTDDCTLTVVALRLHGSHMAHPLQNGAHMHIRHCSSLVVLALFSVALALVAGCATDDDESDLDNSTATTEQELSSNQKAAFEYFAARGLTKRQSAGIVGNLIQESSVNPKAIEFGGGPGRGIAQWSVGGRWDLSHHDNVTWYASLRKESRWTLHTQFAFTWYELHTVGGYGLTALRKTTTIRGATLAFERDFEKCGHCDEAKRILYAQQVYNEFAGSAHEVGVEEVDPNDSGVDDEADQSDAAQD
jgi:Phage tail lysozyme